jgi:ribonuclease HII
MRDIDQLYPAYEFARHKGYGTVAHRLHLIQLGPCEHHRLSFAPVRMAL